MASKKKLKIALAGCLVVAGMGLIERDASAQNLSGVGTCGRQNSRTAKITGIKKVALIPSGSKVGDSCNGAKRLFQRGESESLCQTVMLSFR